MLCSVVKHLGSSNSTQEVGRNTRLMTHVSPHTSFVLSLLPACFTTEQSTVEASLFVKNITFPQPNGLKTQDYEDPVSTRPCTHAQHQSYNL